MLFNIAFYSLNNPERNSTKNIKEILNCFQIDNNKKCFLSTKSAY